jgi:hypothetical protein
VTSTTLDVVLFVLLVTASVVAVVAVQDASPVAGGTPPGRADAVADGLATATTSVNYTLSPGAREADESLVQFGRTSGPEFRRTAHGTYAALLADVAMAGVACDDEPVTHAGDDLAAGVESELGRSYLTGRTQVLVVWRPYPGSRLESRQVYGAVPPRGVSVRAATIDVPSGVPGAREAARARAGDGFGPVARAIARRMVRGLVPPGRARLALRGDYPVDALMRYRYRRLAALAGADVTRAVERGDAAAANRKLVAALTPRIERTLRGRFDDPAAAADAVRTDRVRIVVRTWS